MTVHTFVVSGEFSSHDDFKQLVMKSLLNGTPLRFIARETTEDPTESTATTEREFEGTIRELNNDYEELTVTIQEAVTGKWILINVSSDRVYFDLLE